MAEQRTRVQILEDRLKGVGAGLALGAIATVIDNNTFGYGAEIMNVEKLSWIPGMIVGGTAGYFAPNGARATLNVLRAGIVNGTKKIIEYGTPVVKRTAPVVSGWVNSGMAKVREMYNNRRKQPEQNPSDLGDITLIEPSPIEAPIYTSGTNVSTPSTPEIYTDSDSH